ncbi:hypothetical protein LK494_02985 [Anaerovorax odorimutans]|nr:hypothetical protein [Anaerovorax odorimutans]
MQKLSFLGILFICSGIIGIVNGFIKQFVYIPLGIIVALIGFFLMRKAKTAPPQPMKSNPHNSSVAPENEKPDVQDPIVSNSHQKKKHPIFTTKKEERAKFEALLDSIPNFPISSDGKKIEKDKTVTENIPHSRITVKTKRESVSSYVAVDIETTSLSLSCDIIEISAVRFRDFQPVEKFSTLTKPSRKITDKITNITGITNEMLEGKPCFYQILPSLQEFIGSDNIVAHNINFDVPRLVANGLDLFDGKRKFFDTLDLAKRLLRKMPWVWDDDLGTYTENMDADFDVFDFKLETLLDHYYIYVPTHHRALHDAYATGILFKKMLADIIDLS